MAYKQKGWSPFTQKDDEKPDIVIKYNKDGSFDMTEVQEKIRKEERDSMIAALEKQGKKSIDFSKLKPVNKLDKNK